MNTETVEERFSLKDHLFNREKVTYLAQLLKAADDSFDDRAFIRGVMKDLTSLPLKERIVLIAATLEQHLDTDFKRATDHIKAALPAPLDPTKTDDDFGDFIFAPLGEFVVRNGLKKKYLKTSFATLKELTQRFSMEDAIRYFINEFETETMAELTRWAHNKNYHVRRLASEGTRHLLPWSGRITIPVTTTLPILDILHSDPTRYVTRSVANHLNDIAKVEPKLVIKTLKKWHRAGVQDQKELDWMISHALRTLVKNGNIEALALLGYEQDPPITVSDLKIVKTSQKITKDGTLSFSVIITVQKETKLMIDYEIGFVKANGDVAPKVFKLKKCTLAARETVEIKKNHRFMSTATTYKLHAGKHSVRLQVNGTQFASKDFTIT